MRRLGRWVLAVKQRGTVAETVLAGACQPSRCRSSKRASQDAEYGDRDEVLIMTARRNPQAVLGFSM